MSEEQMEKVESSNVEVEELDDKSLEEASGGVADVNGFMCNC